MSKAEKHVMTEMSPTELREAIKKDRPRPYDLTDPVEMARLIREIEGYLHTCHRKHGTDWEGRQFAMDALKTIRTAHRVQLLPRFNQA